MRIYALLLIFLLSSTYAYSNIPTIEIKTHIENPKLIGKTTLRYFFFKLYNISLWGEEKNRYFQSKNRIKII